MDKRAWAAIAGVLLGSAVGVAGYRAWGEPYPQRCQRVAIEGLVEDGATPDEIKMIMPVILEKCGGGQ